SNATDVLLRTRHGASRAPRPPNTGEKIPVDVSTECRDNVVRKIIRPRMVSGAEQAAWRETIPFGELPGEKGVIWRKWLAKRGLFGAKFGEKGGSWRTTWRKGCDLARSGVVGELLGAKVNG